MVSVSTLEPSLESISPCICNQAPMFRIHPQYRLTSRTLMRYFKLQVHPLHKLMETNPNPNPTPQSGQGTSQALPIKLQFDAVTLRYCHLTISSRILHSSYTLYMQTPHLVGLKLTHHAHLTQHDQLVEAWDCSSGYSWHSKINEQMKGCR